MSKVFPDKDFCIYKNYPFDQLVFTYQHCPNCYDNKSIEFLEKINPSYSCTYIWINQFYHYIKYIYMHDRVGMNNLNIFINSDSFKNSNSCDFSRRLNLCNRSKYHLKNVWGTYDYAILNKKIQIAVKILTYLVSLFSIATNIIVIRIIFAKHIRLRFHFSHLIYIGLYIRD